MITEDQAVALLRAANPVPYQESIRSDLENAAHLDPKMLEADPASTVHEQRRSEMQQQIHIDHVDEETSKNRSRGLLIGIAAAAAVVIGVFALFQATQKTEVAAERTPIEVATAYVEAYRNFDVDRVGSMLAEDARVLPWESYAPRDWQSDLRYLDAAGFQILVSQCGEVPPSRAATLVRCEYEAHGLGSDQIGLEPFSGHAFHLVIENGLVTSSAMGFNFDEFSGTMWYPFQDWIKENHPEDFDLLYENPGLSRQTDEAIALWEQRVQDYAAFVNSQP